MDANEHAKQFLAPVAAAETFTQVARSLIRTAKQDPRTAKLFMDIQAALGDGKDLLSKEQGTRIDKILGKQALTLTTAPPWLRPAILSAYVNATKKLSPKVAQTILANPNKALRRTLSIARRLEPKFMSQVILESARMSKGNSAAAIRLREAAHELSPIVKQLYKAAPAKKIARRASSIPSPLGDSCFACRGGRCTPISCWVIVVVIIVIIVTK